jgi:glucosamine 6-phosphate synthetase-like amidotransferase/phosphosugar isomerase protein
MCGIVVLFGQKNGVLHVLEALHLLEYRAPDSSGLGLVDSRGQLAVRRCVGSPAKLLAELGKTPITPALTRDTPWVNQILKQQGLDLQVEDLRDCSAAAGYSLADLYRKHGLRVGLGDRGAPDLLTTTALAQRLSSRMAQAVEESGVGRWPDLDPDPVRHTFRLLATHVASRVELDETLRTTLDAALKARVPGGYQQDWQGAWAAEVAQNVPGQAFATATRHFQETFPGLAQLLCDDDWERVGGLTAQAMNQIVMGHGRWAMMGAVTEANAHPLVDRSRTRMVCENGSHNATLMLGKRSEQESWWRERGLPLSQTVHRSQNTTEVIAYEWERAVQLLAEDGLDHDDVSFLRRLAQQGIGDLEEQALRLALWRLQNGNAHACTFYGRREPGTLYVSSHDKPIAIVTRIVEHAEGQARCDVMVASDVNAALMLWPGREVERAAQRIETLSQNIIQGVVSQAEAQQEIENILDRFAVQVIFLDSDIHQGKQLLARIRNRIDQGQVVPEICLTTYDGVPLATPVQQLRLNPAMVGKRGFASYTESHIDEIPDVMDNLVRAYAQDGHINLDSTTVIPRRAQQPEERVGSSSAQSARKALVVPGLNHQRLLDRFGPSLSGLRRVLLIGEGSSWRDAQCAAPLLRELLPGVLVTVYRPVELLNLGETVDPTGDLAIEISWSGTTDSLLKVDSMLGELRAPDTPTGKIGSGLIRIAVTGRPQSDLARRTVHSGGTLDVHTGVEISVATVKGFQGILMTLDLLALRLAELRVATKPSAKLAKLQEQLTVLVPHHVRALVHDQERRSHIRRVAARYGHFNKVALVGDSPLDVEAELKIEELAQLVAIPLDFHAASLRGLMERCALVDQDQARILFIINATNPAAFREARPIIRYLDTLGVTFLIHTTLQDHQQYWGQLAQGEVFLSPAVSPHLQPLIDAPFFFDLAVALAYARGLSPEEIDRPRNLAKSVTTTGAERRVVVEARREFHNVSLEMFCSGRLAQKAWNRDRKAPTRAALRATLGLRAALAVIGDPLPEDLDFDHPDHLVVITDTEATESGATMAKAAWETLLGVDVTVYRRFLGQAPQPQPGTTLLRLLRAGAVLAVLDGHTIALPGDMSPLQLELLSAVYLIGLATRLARQRGDNTSAWETGLAQLPLLLSKMLVDEALAEALRSVLSQLIASGYDKLQAIGGGQDFASAQSITRSLRTQGFMAEALYTDSAWHGPLATVGGPGAERDTIIVVLATDPLFQAAALVDTQVYRTRNAPIMLVVPEGNQELPILHQLGARAVIPVPAVPRPFVPIINAALGSILAREMATLWQE